jgi:hypothetical protein
MDPSCPDARLAPIGELPHRAPNTRPEIFIFLDPGHDYI